MVGVVANDHTMYRDNFTFTLMVVVIHQLGHRPLEHLSLWAHFPLKTSMYFCVFLPCNVICYLQIKNL